MKLKKISVIHQIKFPLKDILSPFHDQIPNPIKIRSFSSLSIIILPFSPSSKISSRKTFLPNVQIFREKSVFFDDKSSPRFDSMNKGEKKKKYLFLHRTTQCDFSSNGVARSWCAFAHSYANCSSTKSSEEGQRELSLKR